MLMSYSEKLAARVYDLMKNIGHLEQKRMFSGIAFLVKGKMCINVTKDGLMCRVDPAIHDSTVKKEGCRSMIMKGKELKGWIVVEEHVLKTKTALNYWISLALSFNDQAKSSKKKINDKP